MKDLFVTCPSGFEELLEEELKELGIEKVSLGFCGVYVPKSQKNMWTINYESRIATRVLWPISDFSCPNKEALYSNCRELDWDAILTCKKTFAVDANVKHPLLTNSLFAALVVKDAICDFFRSKTGDRPSVDTKFPDVQLNLFVQRSRATLYLDTSGAPLHKRGWRTGQTEAPIHESLAAALLRLTNYTPEKTLCDPFCGSGTFLIEAALIATNTPPGFFRKKWGFFHMPTFDKKEWMAFKEARDQKRVPLAKGKIFGSDRSRETTEICKQNLAKAGFANLIEINYDEISYYKPKTPPSFILTNPPYGKRLELTSELFEQFDSFLKMYADHKVETYFLSPEDFPLDTIKRPIQKEFPFKNGGLPVKLISI